MTVFNYVFYFMLANSLSFEEICRFDIETGRHGFHESIKQQCFQYWSNQITFLSQINYKKWFVSTKSAF